MVKIVNGVIVPDSPNEKRTREPTNSRNETQYYTSSGHSSSLQQEAAARRDTPPHTQEESWFRQSQVLFGYTVQNMHLLIAAGLMYALLGPQGITFIVLLDKNHIIYWLLQD